MPGAAEGAEERGSGWQLGRGVSVGSSCRVNAGCCRAGMGIWLSCAWAKSGGWTSSLVDLALTRLVVCAQPSKKDRPRMSVATVDERIAGLEHRRATETLTLKEEKEVMAEIKALRASRAGIAGYDQNFKELEGQREKNNSSRKEIKAQMDELDKEIDVLSEKQTELRAELEKPEFKVENKIPELAKERDELRPLVTKLYEELRALRDAYKKENDEWWESEKVWREIDRKERQKKWEADRKQKLIDDELYRKEQFEAEQNDDSDPFTDQCAPSPPTLLRPVAAAAGSELSIVHS